MSPTDHPFSGEDLTAQISQLANQLFASSPAVAEVPMVQGPGGVPEGMTAARLGPSAAAPNFGGLSTAAQLPPIPGAMHAPPLAAGPPPKESDLRAGSSFIAENAGLPFGTLARLPVSGLGPSAVGPWMPPITGGGTLPLGTDAYGASRIPLFGGAPDVSLAPSVGAPPREVSPPASADSIAGTPRGSDSALPSGFRPELLEFRPEVAPFERTGPGLFDPYSVKRDFPILNERVHGKPLVWLDNAATTQKPRAVIERLSHFYAHENSNIHRAAHTLAARATDAYESAREKVRGFLGAPTTDNIVFVRGATEAINLVAQSWGRRNLVPGDEIVITWLEHHANIVPWQQLAMEKGAILRVAPVDDRGQVILEAYERLLGSRTRLVSMTHVSNALGTIVPVREMTQMAHRHGACVLVDGAQTVSHMSVDVQAIDCDFYVFSGHKVFAPTGIGVLYGRRSVLEAMPPWQGGGNMIQDVRFEKTTYQGPPARFEAGTGNIADAVGLGAAIDYVNALGMENISRYEHELLEYATGCLATVRGLTMIGTAAEKAGVLSFVLDGQRTEDVGAALDQEGIAVRSGHHCAQPILRRFGLESSVRASLAPYNTREDIDALTHALHRLQAGHTR